MKFKEQLEKDQKNWSFKDWFWWYWYGFEVRMSIKFYWITKLICKIFGHSKRFEDECARCGIDIDKSCPHGFIPLTREAQEHKECI